MTNLQVLGHIQDARQFSLVVLLPSHVPLSHRMHYELTDGRRLSLENDQCRLLIVNERAGKKKTKTKRPGSDTYLSVPGIVQDNSRVGMVAQKDGHEGGDELMAQCVPGCRDLKQCQHQHVWAVLDGKAEQLLHLLVLAHLGESQQALHQVQAFPVGGSDSVNISTGNDYLVQYPHSGVGLHTMWQSPGCHPRAVPSECQWPRCDTGSQQNKTPLGSSESAE